MTPSPITEIMAHLGCVMKLSFLIEDTISLEHIRAAHKLAQDEWRREQDERNRIDYDLDMAAE